MSEGALQELAAEIIAMSKVDQKMRINKVWDKEVDVIHTERMREIVEQIGWPTISKVGQQASDMAWLLVQHASHDRAFQHRCLDLMRKQPAGEVNPQNIAYLEDRLLVSAGLPQIYGTQFHTVDGELEAFPIKDPDLLDRRRAEIGLSTFAEYKVQLQNAYYKPFDD